MKYLAVLLLIATTALGLDLSSARVDDSYIYSGWPDSNFGANAEVLISPTRSALFRVDATCYDSIGTGQTIDSLIFHVYVKSVSVAGACGVYGVWKPSWGEGTGTISAPTATGVSSNDWDGPTYEWGTAGCNNTGAVGVASFNSSDGSGYDREAAAYDSLIVTTGGTWYAFHVRPSYAQAGYDADSALSVLVRGVSATENLTIASTNEPTHTEWRPWVSVFYHATTPAVTGALNNVLRVGPNRQTVNR